MSVDNDRTAHFKSLSSLNRRGTCDNSSNRRAQARFNDSAPGVFIISVRNGEARRYLE